MQNQFSIRVLAYGPELVQVELRTVAEIRDHVNKQKVTWIDVEGAIDAESLAEIGSIFELHPLALEDVLHNHQRAKVEQYGKHHFIVTRMVSVGKKMSTEQLSIFFGQNFVVTIQEKVGGDCLNPVRERIKGASARFAKNRLTTWLMPLSTRSLMATSLSSTLSEND